MTNRLGRGLGAAAVTALFTAGLATGVASMATADDAAAAPAPCAQQQTQVDRAATKLQQLQVVFNHEKRDLKKAQHAVAAADTVKEKRHAKAGLAHAKADVAEATKVRKAQVQRLARAQQRLDSCQAATPTAPADPSDSPTA